MSHPWGDLVPLAFKWFCVKPLKEAERLFCKTNNSEHVSGCYSMPGNVLYMSCLVWPSQLPALWDLRWSPAQMGKRTMGVGDDPQVVYAGWQGWLASDLILELSFHKEKKKRPRCWLDMSPLEPWEMEALAVGQIRSRLEWERCPEGWALGNGEMADHRSWLSFSFVWLRFKAPVSHSQVNLNFILKGSLYFLEAWFSGLRKSTTYFSSSPTSSNSWLHIRVGSD